MNLLQAIITGIIQGLTEFLPVSSSGHIVLVSAIYKQLTGQSFSTVSQEEIFFDIMLHVGTLIAVFIFFRKDIAKLWNAFVEAVKAKNFKSNYEAQIPLYIIIGTFVTGAVAYPFKDFFESIVENPSAVGLVLVLTGFVLFFTEKISAKIKEKTDKLDVKKSIIIGFAQALAVTPGLSRSGSTIAAGLACGLDRSTSARYSFLLSIPIIILAALFHALDLTSANEFASFNWVAILVGTLISTVVGYFCIKGFISFVSKYSLNVFAYYCFVVGFLMFITFGFVL